ncbi:LLM class flavin-dependent oxidoreductase [Nocardia neocaledoniensis]|uniref:LLM class flavin-dependent oxidoreductase n=1 Tax=Nocardia neocaledoniensis TaxID=236511 RepID=UPI002456931B|nr:LLM class flavin-dependent oxidoreductase [Nocardia neocaledoniensis]
MSEPPLFLGLDLAGTGAHPASWRRADSRAEDLFGAAYWTEAVTRAERLGVDAVFLADSFGLQPGGAGVTRGRLDAVAIAARVAPLTRRIGLVPQVPVTHTEPFHVSKAIAALDFASLGRAGWEVAVSGTVEEAKAFGRKDIQSAESLWQEADEAVEVVTRLWDSWEDGAEIRDVPTGRFIDRDRLHYIDFHDEHFSVKGPSITPRSPQGQPIVTVRADDTAATAVAVRRADLIRVTAPDPAGAAARRTALRAAIADAGRDPDTVRVLLDLPVHLADSADQARAEVDELDRWAGTVPTTGIQHVGTVAELDDLLAEIGGSGSADGVVLRPLAVYATLTALRARPAPTAPPGTFRDHLALPRPTSRYARGAAL